MGFLIFANLSLNPAEKLVIWLTLKKGKTCNTSLPNFKEFYCQIT